MSVSGKVNQSTARGKLRVGFWQQTGAWGVGVRGGQIRTVPLRLHVHRARSSAQRAEQSALQIQA